MLALHQRGFPWFLFFYFFKDNSVFSLNWLSTFFLSLFSGNIRVFHFSPRPHKQIRCQVEFPLFSFWWTLLAQLICLPFLPTIYSALLPGTLPSEAAPNKTASSANCLHVHLARHTLFIHIQFFAGTNLAKAIDCPQHKHVCDKHQTLLQIPTYYLTLFVRNLITGL